MNGFDFHDECREALDGVDGKEACDDCREEETERRIELAFKTAEFNPIHCRACNGRRIGEGVIIEPVDGEISTFQDSTLCEDCLDLIPEGYEVRTWL